MGLCDLLVSPGSREHTWDILLTPHCECRHFLGRERGASLHNFDFLVLWLTKPQEALTEFERITVTSDHFIKMSSEILKKRNPICGNWKKKKRG